MKVGADCVHRHVAPPHGNEVDTMGVDWLLQSMTGGGDLTGKQMEGSGLIILV